eukprot:TRINITY_DN8769_c0_g1_i3.p2 TRINITY_DN8769_c0_g1~~TRINITY_DN8769_c0_g1_i3.p2  ORF type:complete len:215 (+),score=52.16 TRINITY_DN8769_c0_g1_i3:72-716(+)
MCIRDRHCAAGTMINANGWSHGSIIFSWTGSALVNCWPEVLTATCLGIFAAAINVEAHLDYDITLEGHVLAIFPVAFGLVFRTGMSYNRYFEGRDHCGKFVHSARTLCRRALTHVNALDDNGQTRPEVVGFREKLGRLLKLFAVVQRHSIRHTEGPAALEEAVEKGLLHPEERQELEGLKKNFPQTVLIWISREIVLMQPFLCHPDALIWMEER